MDEKWNRLLENLTELFWQTSDFESAARQAVELAGRRFSADSAYIVELDNSALFQTTFLWRADASVPAFRGKIENDLHLPSDEIALAGGLVYWNAKRLSPESAAVLHPYLNSILLAPIEEQGQTVAYFGIADYHNDREDWEGDVHTRRALKFVAQILGIYLLKARYAQRSEKYQQRLQQELEASEKRADKAYELLDSISSGVILVRMYPDGSARPLYGNLGMYRILRIPRTAQNERVPDREVAELEGTYFDDFFANIPQPEAVRVRQEYKAGYQLDQFTVKKYRLLCGDGSYVWVSADLRLCEDTPKWRTYYATYTDMTEEQNLQMGLISSLEKEKQITSELEKANRSKTEFLSRMSHEIRTPMNAIIGLTTIAAAHLDDRPRIEDCMVKIGVSSRHLLSIINDVLDMSKIGDGKMTVSVEPFELRELLSNISALFASRCNEKGQKFDMRLVDVEEERLLGDMMRVQQILFNLLSNAEKFTPSGGSIRLIVQQSKTDDGRIALCFTVSDTGIGIREDFLKRIFLPFEQEDASSTRQYSGTGLGMAITKSLTELMGGSIQVQSEWGKGSRFTVTLPFALPAKIKPEKPQEDLSYLKVLIVDDDEGTCEHASLLLEHMGIVSQWVLGGIEAVRLIEKAHEENEDFDVCFIDWRMPDMDGIETTRQIRKRFGPDVLIIIITAYDWGAIETAAREAGANAFLSKPFFSSTLYNALSSASSLQISHKPPERETEQRLCCHILLCEDNELNTEIAVCLLEEAGATVECAENGRVAVEKYLAAKPGTYDIILMDIMMPVMDGLKAARAIRALERPDAQTVPIIAMTANAYDEDKRKSADAGMNEHLSKPIDPSALYRTIRRYL